MRTLLRRIRGAVGMGVTWAIAWASVVVAMGLITIFLPGTGLEIIFEAADDELLPLLVPPAFAGGVTFSVVMSIAGRRRRFDELSLGQVARWGAVGGLVLGLVPAIGAVLEATATVGQGALVVTSTTLLSSLSATGSLLLARYAEDRSLLAASSEVAEVGLSAEEARELLGRGESDGAVGWRRR